MTMGCGLARMVTELPGDSGSVSTAFFRLFKRLKQTVLVRYMFWAMCLSWDGIKMASDFKAEVVCSSSGPGWCGSWYG